MPSAADLTHDTPPSPPPLDTPGPRPHRLEDARAVGVVGCGVVGEQLCHDLVRTGWPLRVYDTRQDAVVRVITALATTRVEVATSLPELALACHTVFLSLPTPATAPGRGRGHDLTALHATLAALRACGYSGVVLIKSTVCPGTVDLLARSYAPLWLFHAPEFLSSRTAQMDTALPTQPLMLVGAPDGTPAALTERVRTFLEGVARGRQRVVAVRARESEATKLCCNAFYAAKVQLFNEFYHLADQQGISYAMVRHLMLQQGWIHPMHTQVPGPDGTLGFGGACLPKDVRALASWLPPPTAADAFPLLRTLGHAAGGTGAAGEGQEER